MRKFSRNIPKSPQHDIDWGVVLWAWVLLLGTLAVPGFVLWWPLSFVLPGAFLIMTWEYRVHANRIARLRSGETICEFARSFDRRKADPWILRAVYEEFSDSFPIRSSDSFARDLRFDVEDLDDCIEIIAGRAGRSLDDVESNPWFGKIDTVEDLVFALQYQPRLSF